jgi:hypothetical protein
MSRRLFAWAVALAATSACDTRVHAVDLVDASLGPADATPICAEAESHSDLDWLQAHVFSTSCVFSSCHKGTAHDAAGLSLEPGKSWAGLVGQDCQMTIAMPPPTQWVRVVPGDPANSYLMVLVDPKDNTLPGGDSDPDGYDGPIDPKVGSMPYNSPLLCKEKIGALRRWIEAGAPESSTTPDGGVDAMPADGGVDGGADAGIDATAL